MTSEDYRHISIPIGPKFICGYETNLSNKEQADDNIYDLTSAHSTRIANSWHGRDCELFCKLTAESIDIFRTISDRWQTWLELISILPCYPLASRSSQSDQFRNKWRAKCIRIVLQCMNVLLQNILDGDPTTDAWRETLMRLIMSNWIDHDVIIVKWDTIL